jgi:hypothetical protein
MRTFQMKLFSTVTAIWFLSMQSTFAAPPKPADELTYRVPAVHRDQLQWPSPSQVQLKGWLGERAAANETSRLLVVNEEELLDGFRHRPGKHPWIGEHVGKFLHAATLAWANTGDQRLRQKIDRVARELVKTQQADGYLGTYTSDQRWTSWDVWVHKYALIGLLTHHRYTGEPSSLDSCRKIGDLLIATLRPAHTSAWPPLRCWSR